VTPASVLAEQLADARRRGEDFTRAWPKAREAALAAANAPERRDWSVVFTDQLEVWRGAFERRRAASADVAVVRLEGEVVAG
jgi:hypothetical protein